MADSTLRNLDDGDLRRELRIADGLADIGTWEWHPATDWALWSDSLFRIFGLAPRETPPSLAMALERTHPADRERVRHALEEAGRVGGLPPLELRIVRPDGSVRYLRAVATTGEASERARCLIGLVQDVTDQCGAERQLAAHRAVTEALLGWQGFEESAERLLFGLADALGATEARLWLPAGSELIERCVWLAEGAEHSRAPAPPRRAWQLGDVVVDESAATVAIPAAGGEDVLGVVLLGFGHGLDVTAELPPALSVIGRRMGAMLARRRGELIPPVLTSREREVLQLTADGLSRQRIAKRLVVSPSTVKTHLDNVYAKLGVRDRAAAVAHALRAGLIT